ncbi:MAG: efflux RND transporter permease subunit, partial [Phycisphaerae bacterium]
RSRGRLGRIGRRIRGGLDAGIRRLIHDGFVPVYRLASRYRYVTVTVIIAVSGVVGASWAGGRIKFTTFPKIDSDTLRASLILPTGTGIDRTQDVARQMTAAARQLNGQFRTRSGEDVVQRVYSLIGQQSGFEGGAGSHVAEVIVELLDAEERVDAENRGIKSRLLTERWRRNVGTVPDALTLTFGAFRGGPGGKSLEVRLLGPVTERIKPAADALKAKLGTYPGVTDIEDNALPGKQEMKVKLKPGAHALGINLKSLASQLRDAFYGNESLKVQRGRDEIKVMVRYPARQRRTFGDVEEMRVRTPAGDEVPFTEVADVEIARGYTTLRRAERRNVVTVSADVDEEIANADEVIGDLKASGFLDELSRRFPGLRVDFRGQRQQRTEALESLYVWFPVALLGIYTILAAIFRSYVQPIIVMVAIPFGLVGAVIGHWVFGYDVTLLSLFGMVALTGIVVNDSLVLIDRVNRKIGDGAGVHEAVEAGAKERFRAIFLTTATTVAGMGPLLAERSFQAQFLKPMVVAIAFGLMFATMLTLLVVPSLYLIGNDFRRALRWLRTGRWVGPEAVLSASRRPGESEGAPTPAPDMAK